MWHSRAELLRSTKWNANLILTCDVAKLVYLCEVIFWKTQIPVRTPKWPPRIIFAGACHGQKTGTVPGACDKTCGEHADFRYQTYREVALDSFAVEF